MNTVARLGEAQNLLSTANPNSLPIQDYKEFWQNIKKGPTGQPVFANTGKPLPTNLHNKVTTIALNELSEGNRCAFINKLTNTFTRANSNSNLFKKYSACQNELNQNDILVLLFYISTYEEQINEFRLMKALLRQKFLHLEET